MRQSYKTFGSGCPLGPIHDANIRELRLKDEAVNAAHDTVCHRGQLVFQFGPVTCKSSFTVDEQEQKAISTNLDTYALRLKVKHG